MKKIGLCFLLSLIVSASVQAVSAVELDEMPLLGDLNGDRSVDSVDAMELFQHSMLPEMFPVDYPGTLDLDKNGALDIRDALLLFQYGMMPQQYPIEWGENVVTLNLSSLTTSMELHTIKVFRDYPKTVV